MLILGCDVNPYAVKQTKEVEDNSQITDDTMDHLPEELYADICRLAMFRDKLDEDRIRNLNEKSSPPAMLGRIV